MRGESNQEQIFERKGTVMKSEKKGVHRGSGILSQEEKGKFPVLFIEKGKETMFDGHKRGRKE